jgi:hypothetical protein
MKVTAWRETKAMNVCKLGRAKQSRISSNTNNEERPAHGRGCLYAEPTREFKALWKSYDDLSRAATASFLLKPIIVNCFTASTSSPSAKVPSRGGVRCEPRAGIGGGFCPSCDFFFFPNGSRICFKRKHARKTNQRKLPH